MKKTLLILMALIMSAGFAFSQTTIPASSKVPGVNIYNLANTDNTWAGVNIILGSDAGVWPWSTAGDDGLVAFSPEKGATYHLAFSVTSTGASGFRVRWMKDNTYDSHTTDDGTFVNRDTVAADQTATRIPAYFWNTISNGNTQTYHVDFTMDGSQPAEGLVGNVVIRGQSGSTDFVVNTIVITDDAGNMLVNYDKDAVTEPTVLPPSNNVPGVNIYNLANTDNTWAGVNIILGNDAGVWPWSTAGDDGLVAFSPQKGATYHLTFNVTSTGASGFRVRWMKDNTYDSHTTDDGTFVNRDTIAADQTATRIPAYFWNTISNGNTQTYHVDFTMDGSQPAEGLIGNVVIRGQSGSTDFVVNTIVITDDAGNMLVNYDKDAVTEPIVLPASDNVPGVNIYNLANTDNTWAGVNIILGSDAGVWPWSTAGDDGLVAFTPVPDATYHLAFNATSTGASGFRVRWMKDNTYDSHTTDDGTFVNRDTIAADQTATRIPAYFWNTISSGNTQTYHVDFTMDGSQPAEGLVGNVVIRGQSGSTDFVINTLVITDDAGNMLVNYDKDATTGIIQVSPSVASNAYGVPGGIVVNANNEKVSVYGIDGRLMKQALAGYNTTIPMQQGIYIVKVGTANPVKVIVR